MRVVQQYVKTAAPAMRDEEKRQMIEGFVAGIQVGPMGRRSARREDRDRDTGDWDREVTTSGF